MHMASDDDVVHTEREPIGSVLNGFGIHPLEKGDTVLEAFILIKILDEQGNSSWSFRTTSEPNNEELLGALLVQVDVLRRSLTDAWFPLDE